MAQVKDRSGSKMTGTFPTWGRGRLVTPFPTKDNMGRGRGFLGKMVSLARDLLSLRCLGESKQSYPVDSWRKF